MGSRCPDEVRRERDLLKRKTRRSTPSPCTPEQVQEQAASGATEGGRQREGVNSEPPASTGPLRQYPPPPLRGSSNGQWNTTWKEELKARRYQEEQR